MHTGDEEVQFLEGILYETFGSALELLDVRLVSGGSINMSVQLMTSEGSYFVKWNTAEKEDMFEAEARGLDLLLNADVLTLPRVIGHGHRGDKSYLILEFIQSGYIQHNYWEGFGQSLALLHSHTQREFGLHFDNYIGSLHQSNTPHSDSVSFFIEQRLKPQAGLALYNNLISRKQYDKFQALYEALPGILPRERPALVHGDLWSGNVIVDQHGYVCLVDPATHYGLREAEIAFTFLFGGFDPAFYESYYDVFPMEEGFEERIPIYNLYPLLVHVNLFGRSYLSAVERVLDRF
ncbi:fructosamine kinase family protein [Telluribacter sp. SYSU D00476]|uniref:fructosamine kinase family protein n=1 Tax=Telluribacter sp. SYSU D00476 TaxID=2811430 RepID=UPI001FF45AF3|nr:fructosamine kinase family protein [Telluribacter sp. SYSU D00476]